MSARVIPIRSSETRKCIVCEQDGATKSIRRQKFKYLDGDDLVELSANVPVWSCSACAEQFTDGDAEEIRHEAICRYLGRLTPSELKILRKKYNLSQPQWAELTGLGSASVKRWESGSLIQSEAYDKYLRLLAQQSNVESLRRMSVEASFVLSHTRIYQTPISIEIEEQAAKFKLRRWAN